jgi:hypothetical protein
MKTRIVIATTVALAACQADVPQTQPGAEAPEVAQVEAVAPTGTPYGEPLTLTEITPVSAILDEPDAYLGQRVLVEGMVVEVCEMRGCWMDIASDREFEKIQIKVEDGEIVFPLTARGQTAWVEGVVEELALTYEEAVEQAKHQAEEHGEEFDPGTVTGPETIYRIRGLGALIADEAAAP